MSDENYVIDAGIVVVILIVGLFLASYLCNQVTVDNPICDTLLIPLRILELV